MRPVPGKATRTYVIYITGQALKHPADTGLRSRVINLTCENATEVVHAITGIVGKEVVADE